MTIIFLSNLAPNLDKILQNYRYSLILLYYVKGGIILVFIDFQQKHLLASMQTVTVNKLVRQFWNLYFVYNLVKFWKNVNKPLLTKIKTFSQNETNSFYGCHCTVLAIIKTCFEIKWLNFKDINNIMFVM